uniref:Uncharacterized protein n=1 Tax=Meleagris gallopavo TaxID=9103 RepID=A0A803XQY8_MELGA
MSWELQELTGGRGTFLCSDRNNNNILGSAQELLKASGRGSWGKDSRVTVLGVEAQAAQLGGALRD